VLAPHRSFAELAPFRVDVHPEREVVRVAAVGELDLATVAQVQTQIRELRDAGFERIVLDLRELTFMDSSGVALILEEDRCALRDGHGFSLIAGPPAVQRPLEVCCADVVSRLCSDAWRTAQAPPADSTAALRSGAVKPLAMGRHPGKLRHEARPQRRSAC
jgi:anti-sigma B factor antagonist